MSLRFLHDGLVLRSQIQQGLVSDEPPITCNNYVHSNFTDPFTSSGSCIGYYSYSSLHSWMQILKNASFIPCLFRTGKITFCPDWSVCRVQTADVAVVVDDYKPIYRLVKWGQIKKVIKVQHTSFNFSRLGSFKDAAWMSFCTLPVGIYRLKCKCLRYCNRCVLVSVVSFWID